MEHTKKILGESLKKTRESKVMHSQYITSIGKELISETGIFLSLSRGDLKAETVNQIAASQDQT
jgi:hypothetical protein